MFDLEFTKPIKKKVEKKGNKLLLDFEKTIIIPPKENDIVIESEKNKESTKKSKSIKKPIPKKGKQLF